MGASTFLVHYLQLSTLLFALDHFPDNVPKWWDAIANIFSQCHHQCCQIRNKAWIVIPSSTTIKRKFTGAVSECKELQSFAESLQKASCVKPYCHPYI